MTIDEAIVQVKEVAKEKRNEIYTFGMHCNPKTTKDLEMYEQLAEWLELLKWYQQGMEDIPSESGVLPKDVYRAGYNKAIDDFAEKLKEYIDASMLQRVTELETGQALMELMDFSIDKIAEQLKEGSVDNE